MIVAPLFEIGRMEEKCNGVLSNLKDTVLTKLGGEYR
jgi:hypothetical protein